ncbi:MAG: hypothetical protein R6V41_13630, partial [Desulfobacteraceae bacterium]
MNEHGMDVMGANERFRDIDRHFARFIRRMGGSDISVATALVLSRELGDNQVCLVLEPGNPRLAEYDDGNIPCKDPEQWRRDLEKDDVAVGRPGEYKPLIHDEGRVYMHKYYAYESRL